MILAVPDTIDILAMIFGILYTVRKLDVSKREASEFPTVEAGRFDDWQKRAVSVYAWGSRASFLKVVVDLGFVSLFAQHLPGTVVRIVGAAIDLSWVAFMVVTWRRSSKLSREREALGIDLR